MLPPCSDIDLPCFQVRCAARLVSVRLLQHNLVLHVLLFKSSHFAAYWMHLDLGVPATAVAYFCCYSSLYCWCCTYVLHTPAGKTRQEQSRCTLVKWLTASERADGCSPCQSCTLCTDLALKAFWSSPNTPLHWKQANTIEHRNVHFAI